MTLSSLHLPAPESWLRHLDPRWKLASLIITMFALATMRHLGPTTVGLAEAFGLVAMARLPGSWYFDRLRGLAWILCLFGLLLPLIVHQGGPQWTLGIIRVSWDGFHLAILLALKAIGLMSLGLIILATGPLSVTLKAAHSLHVPGIFIQLAMLSYRYVHVLSGELTRLRMALRVRGYHHRANRHTYRTIGHVAGTLLVRGYERAERVGHALRCRGYNGVFHALTEFRTRPGDIFFFATLFILDVGLLAWDLVLP